MAGPIVTLGKIPLPQPPYVFFRSEQYHGSRGLSGERSPEYGDSYNSPSFSDRIKHKNDNFRFANTIHKD
jgi:hypothetical protein